MSNVELYQGDCLELFKNIPDKSINLVVTDPPYNIGKADWDKIKNYVDWCGKWLLECQRVLKDNGSLYFFHNDIEQMSDLILWIRNNTDFVFKQMITWNKRFENARNKGFLDGFVVVDGLRNYQQMAEYCLFYTFQDETGLQQVFNGKNNFRQLKEYFYQEKIKSGLSNKDINNVLGTATNGSGMAGHYFKLDLEQWTLPTKEQYTKLQSTGYFQREYESLRQEYESLRYTFNNQKTHHSVWNYEIAPSNGHITPKPVDLIKNIILHSSNEGDTVLDCFMGSGTTAQACYETNRNFIGIEIDPTYFEIAQKRIAQAQQQPSLLEGV